MLRFEILVFVSIISGILTIIFSVFSFSYAIKERASKSTALSMAATLFNAVVTFTSCINITVPTPTILPINNEIETYIDNAEISIELGKTMFLETYYTLNGNDPKENGNVYDDVINISESTTVSARNKFLFLWSDIEQRTYIIKENDNEQNMLSTDGDSADTINISNDLEKSSNYEEKSSKEYRKGVITNHDWKSEYFGLCYNVPEGMYMYTEDELNDEMGIGQEILSYNSEEFQSKYADLPFVIEMISSNGQGLYVEVFTKKLKDNTDGVYQMMKEYEQDLSQDAILIDRETVNIGDSNYLKTIYKISNNHGYYFYDCYIHITNDRAIIINIFSLDKSIGDSMLNDFTVYEN